MFYYPPELLGKEIKLCWPLSKEMGPTEAKSGKCQTTPLPCMEKALNLLKTAN